MSTINIIGAILGSVVALFYIHYLYQEYKKDKK